MSQIAYVARYGHQTIDTIRAMPLSTFAAYFFAIEDIVRREDVHG